MGRFTALLYLCKIEAALSSPYSLGQFLCTPWSSYRTQGRKWPSEQPGSALETSVTLASDDAFLSCVCV